MENQPKHLTEILDHIQAAMNVIDLYEVSKPGSMAFTKLEEAIMWSQVLVHRIPLKQVVNDTEKVVNDENKVDNIVNG